MKNALTGLKISPKRRAKGSPRTGETRPNKEDLRKLMLAMNPDAEQIEEAVAAAPRVPGAAKALGKGFYEANVEPLLSPVETATAVLGAGKEFVRDPKEFSKSVAKAEMERLRAAGETPEAGAEYYGGFLSPFSMLRRTPQTEVVRPRGQGIVLDYPNAPLVTTGENNRTMDDFSASSQERYGSTRYPKGFVNRTIENGRAQMDVLQKRGAVDPDQTQAIDAFLETKVRKYFVNQFGTKDDPIFKAIKEGRLSSVRLREPGGIREYLPTVAKEGKTRVNPETKESVFYPTSSAQAALEDINKIYDEMTGMRGTVIANRTVGQPESEYRILDEERPKAQQVLDETTQALLSERNAPYEINPSVGLLGYKNPLFADKNKPNRKMLDVLPERGRQRRTVAADDLSALMLAQDAGLPKSLKTAIEKGQPIYDMSPTGALGDILNTKTLVNYLATLPAREIKNLRYEDAVRGAVKLEELKTERKAILERVREGKPVDKKVFLEGVSQPIISYGKESPFPGFTWRQITDPEATTIEGAYIGHSVGGYAKEGAYGPEKYKSFLEGKNRVYSLRDAEGRPVTTVETLEVPGRGIVVTQVKGAGNKTGNSGDKAPYDALLVDFFSKINATAITESDSYLPPLSQEYKKQRGNPVPSRLSARVGAPQPIGRLAPEEPPVPQQVPPAPAQQGIGQLPNAPQNLPNEGFIQAMLRRLGRGEE
jgi:hypothetical protein